MKALVKNLQKVRSVTKFEITPTLTTMPATEWMILNALRMNLLLEKGEMGTFIMRCNLGREPILPTSPQTNTP